jgi:putative endonuclease
MPYHAYILKSITFNRHYIGSCEDLEVRLKRHNAGKVRSSKAYRPYEIVYHETFESRSDAFKREQFFKTLDGYNFLKGLKVY